jgi:hypothetical protein
VGIVRLIRGKRSGRIKTFNTHGSMHQLKPILPLMFFVRTAMQDFPTGYACSAKTERKALSVACLPPFPSALSGQTGSKNRGSDRVL